MGANLKCHFLVCNKTEVGVIYTEVIVVQQVELQSHAGEKVFCDSQCDHIIHKAFI